MTTRLEERYRGLLRVLPADYRSAWEEDMVATFLAAMATDDPDQAAYLADFGRPSWSEAASVVGLAIRLRLDPLAAGGAWRRRVGGEAARLIALIGLLVHAVLATVTLVTLLWLAGRLPGLRVPRDAWAVAPVDRWSAIRDLLEFVAVPAYLAVLVGRWRIGRALAAVSVAAIALSAAVDTVRAGRVGAGTWYMVVLSVLMLLPLWVLGPAAAPRERRPWLVALPAGAALTLAFVFVTQHAWIRSGLLLDWPGVCCLALVAADATHLLVPALRGSRPPAPWSLALGLLTLAVLGQRLLTLPGFLGSVPPESSGAALALTLGETAATVLVGLPLAVLAARAVRRPVATGDPGGAPAGVSRRRSGRGRVA
jgi:hypothetical protein